MKKQITVIWIATYTFEFMCPFLNLDPACFKQIQYVADRVIYPFRMDLCLN